MCIYWNIIRKLVFFLTFVFKYNVGPFVKKIWICKHGQRGTNKEFNVTAQADVGGLNRYDNVEVGGMSFYFVSTLKKNVDELDILCQRNKMVPIYWYE